MIFINNLIFLVFCLLILQLKRRRIHIINNFLKTILCRIIGGIELIFFNVGTIIIIFLCRVILKICICKHLLLILLLLLIYQLRKNKVLIAHIRLILVLHKFIIYIKIFTAIFINIYLVIIIGVIIKFLTIK